MAGLYLHIPFCHSKCAYCDFYSMPRTDSIEAFAQAITQEWGMRQSECAEPFSTIYLGGGTPSILPAPLLHKIIEPLPKGGIREFTIEVNPEDVTPEAAALWRAMGIDRASMGVQSFVDSELQAVGRRHSAEQAAEAVGILRSAGFSNISLDLIYGLPGQTLESWTFSLETLMSMRPEHFSAYILSYEPGTRLWAKLRAGAVEQASDSLITDMYALLCQRAAEHGYEHYEISNFCLPARKALHNSAYWDGSPYLGLGPSAHSLGSDGLRRINPSSLRDYLAAIAEGRTAFEIDEEDDDNRFNDLIITSLRTAEGLPLDRVPAARLRRLMADAERAIGQGLLVLDSGRLKIPERHWIISDSIMAELLQV